MGCFICHRDYRFTTCTDCSKTLCRACWRDFYEPFPKLASPLRCFDCDFNFMKQYVLKKCRSYGTLNDPSTRNKM